MPQALLLTLLALQALYPHAAEQGEVAADEAAAELTLDPPARVELLEGRASLARAEGVSELARGGRELWVDGPAYLEVRPRARVALRWNATASLVVHGPAVLEWAPLSGSRARLEWRVRHVEEAHFEVRRGPVRLVFPGAWTATLETGAGVLVGLPGGGVEWHHDAGLPILLAAPHAPHEVRPPWVVLAGARLRLRPERALPEVVGSSGSRLLDPYARQGTGPASRELPPAWEAFAWPWDEPARVGDPPLVGPSALVEAPGRPTGAQGAGSGSSAGLALPREPGAPPSEARRQTSALPPAASDVVPPATPGAPPPASSVRLAAPGSPAASLPPTAPTTETLRATPPTPAWADGPACPRAPAPAAPVVSRAPPQPGLARVSAGVSVAPPLTEQARAPGSGKVSGSQTSAPDATAHSAQQPPVMSHPETALPTGSGAGPRGEPGSSELALPTVDAAPPSGGSWTGPEAAGPPAHGPAGPQGPPGDADLPPHDFRPFEQGGVLRLTPWGVRRFRPPTP